MFHVVVEWSPNSQCWRAYWSTDGSISWLGQTPEEALNRALANLDLTSQELQYDVPTTVVAVNTDGTLRDSAILQEVRLRRS